MNKKDRIYGYDSRSLHEKVIDTIDKGLALLLVAMLIDSGLMVIYQVIK